MKKKLLSENEVRKFMKFANLQPLTETFIDQLEEDDMVTEQDEPEFADPGMDAAGATEEPPPEAEPELEPELGDELGAEPEGEEAGEEVTWHLTAEEAEIVAPVLEDLADQVREVAGGGEEAPDELGEPEAEVGDLGLDTEPEAPVEAPPTMAPDEEDKVVAEGVFKRLEESELYVSSGRANDLRKVDIINEVARRVAKRLVKAQKPRRNRKRSTRRK